MTVQLWLQVGTIVAAAILAGCEEDKKDNPGRTVKREGEPTIIFADDDDPKMAAAIKKARATADQFIKALGSPAKSQSSFAVKLLVKDGDEGEHMWILPVRFERGKFRGKINNTPDKIKSVAIGDEVQVAKDEISDWMYVEKGKLVGGYTLRALRENMSAQEREELDRSVPFKIE